VGRGWPSDAPKGSSDGRKFHETIDFLWWEAMGLAEQRSSSRTAPGTMDDQQFLTCRPSGKTLPFVRQLTSTQKKNGSGKR